jgi:hypothetical protein
MNTIVTLEEAKLHLRIDDIDTDGDSDLQLKLYAASQSVINYLKEGASLFVDSDGEIVVDSDGDSIAPYPIKAATLIMVGYLYRDRDENRQKEFELGYLPLPVTSLLYPYRVPALA